MAARKRLPSWPSDTRWSAESVARTTGRTPSIPADAHGRSTIRPKPTRATCGRVDHAEHLLGALLAEVGHGDRGLAHLGAAQGAGPGPADQVAERPHQRVEREPVGIVDRRGDEATAAERRPPRRGGRRATARKLSVPEAVHDGNLARGERGRLEQQGSRQEPLGDGPRRVALRQPGKRAAEVDRGRDVVVRDLAAWSAPSAPRWRDGRRRVDPASGSGEEPRTTAIPESTSAASTAPFGPDPTTAPRSTPWSAARRRASGDARMNGVGWWCAAAAAGRSSRAGLRRFRAFGSTDRAADSAASAAGVGAATDASAGGQRRRRVPRRARTVPTGTSMPGSTISASIDAVLEHLDFDVGLLGVDHGDDVATVHGVAGLHPPLDDRADLHVGAERWHAELAHGQATPSRLRAAAAMTVVAAARPPRGAWRRASGPRRCTRGRPVRRARRTPAR